MVAIQFRRPNLFIGILVAAATLHNDGHFQWWERDMASEERNKLWGFLIRRMVSLFTEKDIERGVTSEGKSIS